MKFHEFSTSKFVANNAQKRQRLEEIIEKTRFFCNQKMKFVYIDECLLTSLYSIEFKYGRMSFYVSRKIPSPPDNYLTRCPSVFHPLSTYICEEDADPFCKSDPKMWKTFCKITDLEINSPNWEKRELSLCEDLEVSELEMDYWKYFKTYIKLLKMQIDRCINQRK